MFVLVLKFYLLPDNQNSPWLYTGIINTNILFQIVDCRIRNTQSKALNSFNNSMSMQKTRI